MRISVCEVTCFRWAAERKSLRDIAVLEGLSDEEVTFLVSNALAKLGASTLAEAIENAKLRRVI